MLVITPVSRPSPVGWVARYRSVAIGGGKHELMAYNKSVKVAANDAVARITSRSRDIERDDNDRLENGDAASVRRMMVVV
jgi:hypothetical protein